MVGRNRSRGSRGGFDESFWSRAVGMGLILFVIGALLAGSVALYRSQELAARFDSNTFCPKEGPTVAYSILVDRTDTFNEVQTESLRKLLLLWAARVPEHGALRIYEVKGGAGLRPVVDVCTPGTGADASELDSNPAQLRQRYRERYLSPIAQMVAAMADDTEQSSSPILEAVQAISVHDFGEGGATGPNVLVIVSDLLQHSEKLDLYGKVPKATDFLRAPMGRSLRADLKNVDVTVYLVARPSAAKYQSDDLGAFWLDWIDLQGGVTEFKHLLG